MLLVLSMTFLAGCAVQVKTIQKPSVDFSQFSSWCWMQGCEITYQGPDFYNNQEVMDEIANAIASNMYDKGYEQKDATADLLVNYYVILKEDSAEVSDIYEMMFNGGREWLNITYPEYHQFLEGTLVIDVLDRKNSELIWTSKAVRYLEVTPDIDKKEIWDGVTKAMRKLPVKGEE